MSMSAWNNLGMMMLEAQQVIWLRTLAIAGGGAKADKEARLMVSEKVAAATETGMSVMQGATADSVVRTYRRKVRANLHRLTR